MILDHFADAPVGNLKASRTFERSFQLADHVTVKGASSENGLLHVELVREIPEAMKARTVPIASYPPWPSAECSPMKYRQSIKNWLTSKPETESIS